MESENEQENRVESRDDFYCSANKGAETRGIPSEAEFSNFLKELSADFPGLAIGPARD